MSIFVTKSDGTTEKYDPHKLFASLTRAGAEPSVAQSIAHDIEDNLRDGITTREIYAHAFEKLRTHKHVDAARYSLKRAMLEFGPSGFPFEMYIAELFRAEGFRAEVDQLIQGGCVEHEVDVIIHKKDETVFAEAKFHNTIGFKTDLKTVLYVQARIDDIAAVRAKKDMRVSGLVVTNTKFTDKAIQYAECKGLELLGWDYPRTKTLHERIDDAKLYPVTALTTLSQREKMALLSQHVVLCNAIPAKSHLLEEIGVSGSRAGGILEEVGALCVPGKDI